jgi:hypothetical protein
MVIAMSSFASYEAEYWVHNSAPDMFAPLVHDIDHFREFMCTTMCSFAAREAETWSYNAPDMVAPLAPDVDHFREFMFATMRSFAAREAECWVHHIAFGIFAPFAHDIDHFRKLMCATMSPFAAREAEYWVHNNALDIFAPLAPDVDHVREFMFATMRPFAALEVGIWSFGASGIFALRMCDVDESMRFAVHRATCRRLPFPAIIRLFLFWEAFLAIRHIIPKYMIYDICTLKCLFRKKSISRLRT